MIDPDKLADDIENCFGLTSDQITPPMIQRQLERIRQDKTAITRNTLPTHKLAELVSRNVTHFLTDEATALIGPCNVFVVPLPLGLAYSKPERQIVIGNGLMNLMAACGYQGFIDAELPEDLKSIKPLKRFPRTSASEAVSLFLFALIYRHYQFGEPLPDFRAWHKEISQEERDEKVRHSVAGAATFILLHELGHLTLKHHDGKKKTMPANLALSVHQSLSDYQIQEFEADDFAMTAIKEKYQPLHFAWINMALNFHLQNETVRGERAIRHPINVNRLSYAFARCNGVKKGDYHAAHLERMGRAFENIERNNEELKQQNRNPLITSWSRDEILAELQALEPYLEPRGFGLGEVIGPSCELADWTQCLF